MASGPIVGEEASGGGGGDGSREKLRWAKNKVYYRKSFRGLKKNVTNNFNSTDTDKNVSGGNNNKDAGIGNDINSNPSQCQPHTPPEILATDVEKSPQKQATPPVDGVDGGPSSPNHAPVVVLEPLHPPVAGNGMVGPVPGPMGLEDREKVSLSSLKSQQERRQVRRKLEQDLSVIRDLVKKLEAQERQGSNSNTSFNQLGMPARANDGVYHVRLKRVHSSVASVGPNESSRPINQLSVSVLENSPIVSDNVEKEKRTPKANQFYRNSEFLLAKDRFPPAESNKKSKSNGKKNGGGELGFGMGKYFKSCSSLLERLMKHKHGWVFNSPVEVEALGLLDYYTIIKHPMDLGTVKSRLNKNWYKSPREFAEDVRLTFCNAMTYNPEGQDVHTMAEQLLKIFEDKWAIIEADYIRQLRFAVDYEVGLHTPTSRKTTPVLSQPSLFETRRIFDRTESIKHRSVPKLKPMGVAHPGRTPALKKPKAKDPHKRDMTYEEKQKLSTNLQNLPSDKLDQIVQIIKKRNSALCQHDDEIEVDIDGVDAETLWELDRFVTNYKKSLSKKKRKAELASQARLESVVDLQAKKSAPVVTEVHRGIEGDKNASQSLPTEVENQANNGSGSSSSSSSGSDSGSSSSDSDTESSSADGSDARHSPRT